MNFMSRKFLAIIAVAIVGMVMSRAQSPAPIVVQAMSPATAAPAAKAAPQDVASNQEAIKILEQIKSANQETLKRQQALLEQFEELKKAADQLKIFTKRG